MILRYLFIVLVLFSINTFASEEFCALENKEVVTDIRERHNKSSWFDLTLPLAKNGKLYRIQLRYDHLEKYGSHEVFTELAFDESAEGYHMFIDLAEDHKPVLIMATYHLNGGYCYSNLYINIQHQEVHAIKNGA